MNPLGNLDHATAEHFAGMVNKLKGKVSMLFITHQLSKALKSDRSVILGSHSGNSSGQIGPHPDAIDMALS